MRPLQILVALLATVALALGTTSCACGLLDGDGEESADPEAVEADETSDEESDDEESDDDESDDDESDDETDDDESDDEESDDEESDETADSEEEEEETEPMPEPEEEEKKADTNLKSPTAREAFIGSFNKNIPAGCKLTGKKPELTEITYRCRKNKLEDAKAAVIKACDAYQLVGFEKMKLNVKDGTGECTFDGGCECKGEPDKKEVTTLNGTYKGTITGGATGTIKLSVKNKKVSGNVQGTRNGEKFLTGFGGSANKKNINASGSNKNTNLRVSGSARGKTITGRLTGMVNGKPASLNFTASK